MGVGDSDIIQVNLVCVMAQSNLKSFCTNGFLNTTHAVWATFQDI